MNFLCVLCVSVVKPCSNSTHVCEGASREQFFSLDNHYFTDCLAGHSSQSIFTPVFQNQRYGFRQTVKSLWNSVALPVGPGYLRAIGNVPVPVALDDCCKFVTPDSGILISFTMYYDSLSTLRVKRRRAGEWVNRGIGECWNIEQGAGE